MELSATIAWLKQQKALINLSIDQGFPEEGVEIAREALERIVSQKEDAVQAGFEKEWLGFEDFFSKSIGQTEKLCADYDADELDVKNEWRDIDERLSSEELMIQAEGFFHVELYDKALESLLKAYDKGSPDTALIFDILECFTILEKFSGQADFLTTVLDKKNLDNQDQAELTFYLGNIYLRLDRTAKARAAFLQVKNLFPDFPGLDKKLASISDAGAPSYNSPFGLLVEKGRLSEHELSQTIGKARKEKRPAESVIMEDFNIPASEMGESLTAYYNVPHMDFSRDLFPSPALFEKLDREYLKKNCFVPIELRGDTLHVIMNNPQDLHLINEIRFIFGTRHVEPRVALRDTVTEYIEDFFGKLSGKDLEEMAIDVDLDNVAVDVQEEADDSIDENDSQIIRALNAILVEAYRRGASDIHIEPSPKTRSCSIRFRADGSCYEFQKTRIELARPLLSRIKIMANLDIAERRMPQDGRIKLRLPNQNKTVEYRVATYPSLENHEDAVLRVLASGTPLPLDRLGMLEGNFEKFTAVLKKPYGLVLVVGPTGSGKTTSLHSALSYINTPDRKVLTAEDPIEITQEGLRQVQVHPKIGLTFARALRSFLRADPDVIMIGEMRDEETAHIAVESSLTGHLVFSTLHTNSAPETVSRLLDMNLDPFNFADSLLCVLAQRLMKTLCKKCKEPYTPSNEELNDLRHEFGPLWDERVGSMLSPDLTLYRAKGCQDCNKGYRGRVGVHELMVNSATLKDLIKYRKPTEEIRCSALEEGMLTLKQDGILKVLKGFSDMAQVRAVAG